MALFNPLSSKGGNEDIIGSVGDKWRTLHTGAGNRAAVNRSNATKSPFAPRQAASRMLTEVKDIPEKFASLYIVFYASSVALCKILDARTAEKKRQKSARGWQTAKSRY